VRQRRFSERVARPLHHEVWDALAPLDHSPRPLARAGFRGLDATGQRTRSVDHSFVRLAGEAAAPRNEPLKLRFPFLCVEADRGRRALRTIDILSSSCVRAKSEKIRIFISSCLGHGGRSSSICLDERLQSLAPASS
jgi:hypothetical protein